MSDEEDILGEAEKRVGTVLRGKYHIDRVVGVGGMAAVYAATHRNRKQFAVKVLHPELCTRRDIRARFLREGYVANSVNHPGVVAVIDDDLDDDGSAFLVMDLLDGINVETLCSRSGGRLGLREALAITQQLLDVLEVAHAASIVHRDVKPANLFVLKDGQVKVLDFGIARLRDLTAGVKSTRGGALLGTPAFMAPEQALGHANDVDARTDIWAAGASLFTMLSGVFVHEGENGRQMLIRAATASARSLGTVVVDVPVAVVDLVAKALEFDKASRWKSAGAMRDVVNRIYRDLFGPSMREPLMAFFDESPRPLDSAGSVISTVVLGRVTSPRTELGGDAFPTPVSGGSLPVDLSTPTAKPAVVRNPWGSRRSRAVGAAVTVAATIVAMGAVAMRPSTTKGGDALASSSGREPSVPGAPLPAVAAVAPPGIAALSDANPTDAALVVGLPSVAAPRSDAAPSSSSASPLHVTTALPRGPASVSSPVVSPKRNALRIELQ